MSAGGIRSLPSLLRTSPASSSLSVAPPPAAAGFPRLLRARRRISFPYGTGHPECGGPGLPAPLPIIIIDSGYGDDTSDGAEVDADERRGSGGAAPTEPVTGD